MINEEQALDASIFTRKSRRENARQGFYNGGPLPLGVARQVKDTVRMKLEVVPEQEAIVRRIFD